MQHVVESVFSTGGVHYLHLSVRMCVCTVLEHRRMSSAGGLTLGFTPLCVAPHALCTPTVRRRLDRVPTGHV